jgi:hypothetical protein
MIGCGGLLVLVIVIIIIGIFAAPRTPPSSPNNTTIPQGQSSTPSSTAQVTVRVTGDPGLPFSGSYGSMSAGQSSVQGQTPQAFTTNIKSGSFSLDSVSATMQKKSPGPGTLTVQIISDGSVKKEQSTTADYGVVSVAWNTTEK